MKQSPLLFQHRARHKEGRSVVTSSSSTLRILSSASQPHSVLTTHVAAAWALNTLKKTRIPSEQASYSSERATFCNRSKQEGPATHIGAITPR